MDLPPQNGIPVAPMKVLSGILQPKIVEKMTYHGLIGYIGLSLCSGMMSFRLYSSHCSSDTLHGDVPSEETWWIAGTLPTGKNYGS